MRTKEPKTQEKPKPKVRIALWKCLECDRKFYSTQSARKATLNGCPGCGGVDIDLA